MKFFRYRRPSLNNLLGVTKAKKRMEKELGITEAMKPFRWWTNTKRRFKRKIGYESEGGRLIRNGLPRPGGCLVVVVVLGRQRLPVTAAVLGMELIGAPRPGSGRDWEPRSDFETLGGYGKIVGGRRLGQRDRGSGKTGGGGGRRLFGLGRGSWRMGIRQAAYRHRQPQAGRGSEDLGRSCRWPASC